MFTVIASLIEGSVSVYFGYFDEPQALRVTAISFYLLTIGLILSVIVNLYRHRTPESAYWGVVISLISISVKVVLMNLKIKVGNALHSTPITADAHCTRACIYMSVVLLASSLLFSLTRIAYLDSIGTIGNAYYSFKESREAWEKAPNNIDCDCD